MPAIYAQLVVKSMKCINLTMHIAFANNIVAEHQIISSNVINIWCKQRSECALVMPPLSTGAKPSSCRRSFYESRLHILVDNKSVLALWWIHLLTTKNSTVYVFCFENTLFVCLVLVVLLYRVCREFEPQLHNYNYNYILFTLNYV